MDAPVDKGRRQGVRLRPVRVAKEDLIDKRDELACADDRANSVQCHVSAEDALLSVRTARPASAMRDQGGSEGRGSAITGELLLTVDEAARRCAFGRSFFYTRLIRTGLVPSVKVGGARRVLVSDLKQFVESLKAGIDVDE